ncbi:phospholipase [Salmonella enterica subsp. enterica serovar Virchow]|nr:phospholipase [Salmonella enterica subsp. enterica serovar Virchow]
MQEFQVSGTSSSALFTLKIHRGDGMCLLAMNWKTGKPPEDFVGFAIEYKEPGGDKFFSLKNRIAFPDKSGEVNPNILSTRLSPIQKFRWVHFPRNADLAGLFTYKVTPVFMNDLDELSYGEPQIAELELRRETYAGILNIAFTRGFISSQAFIDRYSSAGQSPKQAVETLLPAKADDGLNFVPTHPRAAEALVWMGFEARSAILEVLDQAIADNTAEVRAVVYDLNEPGIVERFEKLGKRLRIIIDDSGTHGKLTSAETTAFSRLVKTAAHARRQHLGKLQHNKTIVVGGTIQACVCGSTNDSWRGFFVQNNNAIILRGAKAVEIFMAAYNSYENSETASSFSGTRSAAWNNLQLPGIDAQISFSPRSSKNAVLEDIADDIANNTKSSLFFSLAFLYQTPGLILNAVRKIKNDTTVFSYGISDHAVDGLEEDDTDGPVAVELQKPGGQMAMVHPQELTKDIPLPFREEPTGGSGTRMHHKFIVIDFDKPTARVYMGSFNFSSAADTSNGENLLLIRDPKIAVSYMVEAIRIFDHYHFRVALANAKQVRKTLQLMKPPRKPEERAWWEEDYKDLRKIRDRELFA